MNLLAVAVSGRGLVDAGEPVFHADDEALLRGRAAFETTRVYGGQPFMLHAHVERLRASSARLGLPEPDERECGTLADLVIGAASPDVALRLYWTGTTLVATAGAIDPSLDEQRTRGLRLAVVRWSTGALASAKSTSYAENMRAQDEAVRLGEDDALFVSHEGVVLEAPTANIWWREDDRLVTPSLDLPILAGVTRSVVHELSPYDVVEGAFPVDRLLTADEAFLSSSIREVMPVVAVDGRAIGDGKPGSAARALQDALRARATATLSV